MAEPSSSKKQKIVAQPPQQITHDDIMSMILKHCDVPELTGMLTVSKAFKHLISEDKAFVDSYNHHERTSPWVFTYSVVTLEEKQVGFIYGMRLSDNKRVSFGPFVDGKDWELLDMSDSLVLFHVYEDDLESFVVVNPITMMVERVAAPGNFPEDSFISEDEYDCKITTDAPGYNIVYHQVVDGGNLCCFHYDSSDGGRWTKSEFDECLDKNTLEDEKLKRIVLRVDNERLGHFPVLYTLFYRAGNDIPVYKVTLYTDVAVEPVDLDEDDDVEDTNVQNWYYCREFAVRMESYEERRNKNDSKIDVKRISLYRRNKNGEYELLDCVRDPFPDLIVLASASIKELDGILYVGFQTDSVGSNGAATTYVYSYQIKEEKLLLEGLEFPPLDNGNKHSRAVFTRRLTLPVP